MARQVSHDVQPCLQNGWDRTRHHNMHIIFHQFQLRSLYTCTKGRPWPHKRGISTTVCFLHRTTYRENRCWPLNGVAEVNNITGPLPDVPDKVDERSLNQVKQQPWTNDTDQKRKKKHAINCNPLVLEIYGQTETVYVKLTFRDDDCAVNALKKKNSFNDQCKLDQVSVNGKHATSCPIQNNNNGSKKNKNNYINTMR